MTVRCIPEAPAFREDSGGRAERAAWTAVRDALAHLPEATLFANLRIVHEDAEAEIDLLAVIPDVGILTVETKAGTWSRTDGTWQQRNRSTDPFAQADRARHALLRRLKPTPASLDGVRWGTTVAFPDMSTKTWEAADAGAGRVLDAPTLAQDPVRLAALLRTHVSAGTHHQGPAWTQQRAAAVVRFLEARLEGADLTVTESDELADRFAQQYDLLDMVVQFPRYAVVGGAGTGKTWLALEQARRWTDDGMRVALVCYTRGLAAHLAGHPDTSPRSKRRRPAWVGLSHDLPRQWGAPPPTDATKSDYWETELPAALERLARGRTDLFDAIVVDESQDFGPSWWPALLACLKDPEHGRLALFGDDAQRVFRRESLRPFDIPPLVINGNVRNAGRIVDVFKPLSETTIRTRRERGPAVTFVPCTSEDAIGVADDQVDLLLETYDPGQVALLTTAGRHPVHREVVENHGYDAYWEQTLAGDGVCYAHVRGFKGLERAAVVLCVNGVGTGPDENRGRELLYVGLSRARHRLVVVGDPAVIEAAAGKDVLGRLQAGV